jgi:hypothetical protein
MFAEGKFDKIKNRPMMRDALIEIILIKPSLADVAVH